MPWQVKLVLSGFIILVGIGIYFIDPNANNAGSDRMWKLGRYDPFRNILFKQDGTFRKHTKLGLYLWFLVCITGIWLTQ